MGSNNFGRCLAGARVTALIAEAIVSLVAGSLSLLSINIAFAPADDPFTDYLPQPCQ